MRSRKYNVRRHLCTHNRDYCDGFNRSAAFFSDVASLLQTEFFSFFFYTDGPHTLTKSNRVLNNCILHHIITIISRHPQIVHFLFSIEVPTQRVDYFSFFTKMKSVIARVLTAYSSLDDAHNETVYIYTLYSS